MHFKQRNNKINIDFYKKKECLIKVYKFLFIYLLNILQTKQGLYKKIEILNLQRKFLYFQLILKKSSKVKLFRNCIMTRRSRAVYRPYGLSRCALKELIQSGKLTGYTKAIW